MIIPGFDIIVVDYTETNKEYKVNITKEAGVVISLNPTFSCASFIGNKWYLMDEGKGYGLKVNTATNICTLKTLNYINTILIASKKLNLSVTAL